VVWIGNGWLVFLLGGVGLFLSAWIVIPAPTFSLLPLGVGAPELSLWLFSGNCIVALLALFGQRYRFDQGHDWLGRLALGCSLGGIFLSSLPLIQLPAAVQRFETVIEQALGTDYRAKIPSTVQAKWRSQPFRLTDVFTGIPTPRTHDAVRHTTGILFAKPDQVSLTLDIHRPVAIGQHPTIVTFYGGGWQNGDPSRNAELNRYLAGQGYTVVAIDYRHAPRYHFPVQLMDVQTALAFILQHATEYDIDPERIAVMGRSAGAHLAMLAAWQPGALPLRAVVNYYGPVDLAAGYRNPPQPDPIDSRATLEAFLGGSPDQLPTEYQQASPLTFVRPQLPPTLLVYGRHDHIVEAKYGNALSDRLQATGNIAPYLEIPWAEHAFDEVFHGISNQAALYYTERFLAWALYR